LQMEEGAAAAEKAAGSTATDNFELDVSDDRFAAVFEKPDFHVDPSLPNFKKTRSMKKIVEEKQKRILKEDKKKEKEEESKEKAKPLLVDSLVKAIKAKTKVNMAKNGKKKKKRSL